MSSLYLRRLKHGAVYYGQVKFRGKWRAFNTGKAGKREARAVLAGVESEIAAGRDPFHPRKYAGLTGLIEAFLSARKPFWARKTYVAYKETLARLRAVWGDSVASEVTAEDVTAFRESLAGMRPASINHYLRHAAAFLRWCVAEGHIRSVVKIEAVKAAGPGQRDYYTADECRLILQAAEGVMVKGVSLRLFLALLMTSGLRIGEATALRWDWIDPQRGQIRLPPEVTKAGRKRVIPVATELLAEFPAGGDRPFPFAVSGYLGKTWRAVVKRAGVRYLKLHNLRDTAAVGMILSGVPLPVVSRILGHASVTTTMQHYADLTGEEAPNATAFATALLRDSCK